ncbi:MAG: hypothetical protein ACREND_09155 [Gemmatimonadaceae bacterium]
MLDAADSSLQPYVRAQDTALVLRALRQAVREVLLDHKRTSDAVAVWQDGRVVWIPPEDIVVPEP